MKLYITELGDASVGLGDIQYEVECPFNESIDSDNLEYFRDMITAIYSEFSEQKVTAIYGFEIAIMFNVYQ